MTERIKLNHKIDLINSQNNEYSVDNGLLIQGDESKTNLLISQILQDHEIVNRLNELIENREYQEFHSLLKKIRDGTND